MSWIAETVTTALPSADKSGTSADPTSDSATRGDDVRPNRKSPDFTVSI